MDLGQEAEIIFEDFESSLEFDKSCEIHEISKICKICELQETHWFCDHCLRTGYAACSWAVKNFVLYIVCFAYLLLVVFPLLSH